MKKYSVSIDWRKLSCALAVPVLSALAVGLPLLVLHVCEPLVQSTASLFFVGMALVYAFVAPIYGGVLCIRKLRDLNADKFHG